jgi:hypothetical protein
VQRLDRQDLPCLARAAWSTIVDQARNPVGIESPGHVPEIFPSERR